jgi:hypothetical protein
MVRTLHDRRTSLVAACLRKSRRDETIDVTMLARTASLPHRVRTAPHSPDAASRGAPTSRRWVEHRGCWATRRCGSASRCRARRGGLDRAQDLQDVEDGAFRESEVHVAVDFPVRVKVQGQGWGQRLRCRRRQGWGQGQGLRLRLRPGSWRRAVVDVDRLTSRLTSSVDVEGDVERRLHRGPRRRPRIRLVHSATLRVHKPILPDRPAGATGSPLAQLSIGLTGISAIPATYWLGRAGSCYRGVLWRA